LQAILGDLILVMGDAQVMYKLVTDTYGSAVVKETVEQVKDETAKKKLVDSLLVWVNFEPPKAESERKYHPLEEKPAAKEDIVNHPVAHFVLKRLIKKDTEVAQMVLEKISPNIENYVTNKYGSWVVLGLITNENTKKSAIKVVLPHLKQLTEIVKELAAPHLIVEAIQGNEE